jgi:hypothetical protein
MAAGPSEPTLSPLGYRHPPRYQKWLERARAAYDPPEPYRDGRIDPAPFVTWLCDSIGGLAHQVAAEVDRLRISMAGRDYGERSFEADACHAHGLNFDLWSVFEGFGVTRGTMVMTVKQSYGFSLAGGKPWVMYTTRNMLRPPSRGHMSASFFVCFDFQSAIADLTHELSPWGGPFLTPGFKASVTTEGSISGPSYPYGGPPTKFWDDPSPFDEDECPWIRNMTARESRALRDLAFKTRKAKKGGARLELSHPKKDMVMIKNWARTSNFNNGDPLTHRLILVLPAVRHQRLFAIGRIQRWWRGVRMRLARQAMLEQILAEIYAPGGAAAALAAASFAAGASRQ